VIKIQQFNYRRIRTRAVFQGESRCGDAALSLLGAVG
jgi:hypothetical protein